MSAVLILFCLVLLHDSGSSEGLNITAGPGENVTLTCKAEDTYSVVVLEWKRDNLGKKKVFVVKDGRPFLSPQHESFKNRVFLLDPQMKNGDLSVVLKNVKIEDSGIYMCRVLEENDPFGSPLKMISSINLSVSPAEEKGEQKGGGDDEVKDGDSRGHLGLIVLPVLLAVLVLLAVVCFWIYKKIKGSNQSSRGSNKHQNHEGDHLNSYRNTANI